MKPEIEVPNEWGKTKLSNLLDYEKGKKPTESSEFPLGGFLPYLTTGYLREGTIIKYAKSDNNNVKVENDDILLLWDGSNAGEFFIGKLGILASTMVKLKLKKDIDKKFLFYQLKSKELYLKKLTQGTGIPHVDKIVLRNININKPPIKEQQKIADILSKIDEQIDLTEKIIEKTEELKKGLMQKLFTKGIGHAKLKKNELGEISEEWKISKIGEETKVGTGGTPNRKFKEYYNGNIN